jgi:uncharacterized membrane protein
MAQFSTVEYILLISMFVSVLISGYLTVMRVVYGKRHLTYDAWIFGVNIALLLQVYDNHCDKL